MKGLRQAIWDGATNRRARLHPAQFHVPTGAFCDHSNLTISAPHNGTRPIQQKTRFELLDETVRIQEGHR